MRNIADKLSLRGAAALSDEELIATIISESLSDDAAVAVAQGLMAECGGKLVGVAGCDLARLRMIGGIGKAKALRIKAAVELGSRVVVASASMHDVVASDRDVVRIMEPVIGSLQHEECWVLYLTSANRIIERQRVSQGGLVATVVDHRLVVKRALELFATRIVVAHNHPSGSAVPSEADVLLTRRIREAAALFDIELLDHVIIASSGESYSLKQGGQF